MKEVMRSAIPAGGAEMGQRSPRVLTAKRAPSASGSNGTGSAGKAVPRLLALAADPNHWRPGFGVAGQDVSGHQGNVDWQTQWNHGSRWAYVKASEGNYYLNERYAQQYNGSRNVGMVRGAYHFAIPNWSSGADQARYFVANGGRWQADGYTLPPVLDIEYNPYEGRTDIPGYNPGNVCYDLNQSQMRAWISEFGNTVRSLTGRLPVIYSTTDWWTRCTGNASGYGDYPLWIAAYPSSPTNSPGTLPAGWGTFSMWQYSSSGPFAGDSNVWNGDYNSLKFFTGTNIPAAAVQQIGSYRTAHPALGNETTAITCGLAGGGCYQGFAGGTVMWSASSGAYAVEAGAIAAAWRAHGAERGGAGYPTSDMVCGLKDNGCFQNFQGGSIVWPGTSRAYLIKPGAIRDYWAKNGYENGPVGYPAGELICGLRDGGCFQNFQGGAVLHSPSSGAHIVKPGAIMDTWARGGFENGLLGYPAGDMACGSSTCQQQFVGGIVTGSKASGYWPIYMGIAASWSKARAESISIGLPLGTEVCGIRNGGCYQVFQGGVMLFSPPTGAFPVTGRIHQHWQKSGFENGSLGYPVGMPKCGLSDSGCTQSFERGMVAHSASTAPQTVRADTMQEGWIKAGAVTGSLGYPTSAEVCGLRDAGCFQMFAKGALMYAPGIGAYPSVNGPIRDLWQRTGFENGRLGFPTSGVVCGLRDSGCFQNYLGGTIMWSPSSGAHPLHLGSIRDAWARSGFEAGPLRYPVSGPMCGLRDGGCFQNFQGGTVIWSSTSGAQIMRTGPIQQKWASQGFEAGRLGYPTGNQSCNGTGSSCSQSFQGGSITWTTSGGAVIRLS